MITLICGGSIRNRPIVQCGRICQLSSKAKVASKSSNKQQRNAAAPRKERQPTAEIIMTLQQIKKTIPGGRVLFENVSLNFLDNVKIGVLGPNGCGKSSLMKVIAGLDKEFDGELWRRPGVKIKYLAQEPDLDPTRDVMGNVRLGFAHQEALLARFDEISVAMGEPDADFDKLLEEQATLQAEIEHLNAWNLMHEVETAMSKLHLPPRDAAISGLSGGERRRVALCRLLLEKPNVLLLDEPTNHLDAESVAWLEGYLKAFKGTVISVTHDRYFLDNVATWILEIDRGVMYPYQGNYTSWLTQKQKRLNLEKKGEAAESKRLASELQWLQKRGTGEVSKARLAGYNALADKSTSQRDRLAKLEGGQIVIPRGPRLGNEVLDVVGVTKAYGNRTLFKDVSFSIQPGTMIGVVGANGSGKTTLFDIVAGTAQPDAGTVKWGRTTKVGLVSQNRAGLDAKKTAYEEIAQGSDMVGDVSTRAYVSAFNLKGAAQEKRVGSLSGGERNRVHLAKVLKEGHNVLLLDEPTNDLDVETLRSLENALEDFAGCAMIISHDRYFLDRVCTHTIAFEDDGEVIMYSGNYSEYSKWMTANGRKTRALPG